MYMFQTLHVCVPPLQYKDSYLNPYKHLPPTFSALTLQQLLAANRFAVLPFGDPITRISISN